MEEPQIEFLGELRIGRLYGSVRRAAATGLVIYPGLFLLLVAQPVHDLSLAGLTASFLTALTLVATLLGILELLGGSSERAGTYALVHESLGRPGGFIAGWSILAANLVLAMALLQAAATSLLGVIPFDLPIWAGAVFFFLLLSAFQLYRWLPHSDWVLPLTGFLFLLLVLALFSAIPRIQPALWQPSPHHDSNPVMHICALLITLYAGLEAILASRRQIVDSSRRMPRALIWTLLGGVGLFLVGILIVAGLPGAGKLLNSQDLIALLLGPDFPLPWLGYGLSSFILVVAANACLMAAARQVHALSRRGALPRALRRVRKPFRLPPLLFLFLFCLGLPLLLWAPTNLLIEIGAGLFVTLLLLFNIAAIRSRHVEPDRRRPFEVPLFPLVPGIAGGMLLWMLLSLSPWGLLAVAIWTAVGVLLYRLYGWSRQVEAQVGVEVFGKSPTPEKEKGVYRILVPVAMGMERHLVLELATAMASQMSGELIPLQVIPMSDPLAMERGQRLAKDRNTLFQWSTRIAARSDVPTFPITRLARNVHQGILDTAIEEQCDLILLSWVTDPDTSPGRLGQVLDPVIRMAPCDVVVLALQDAYLRASEKARAAALEQGAAAEDGHAFNRILVPTAGGPHAPLATRLAMLLAREYDSTVTTVYVSELNPSEDAIQRGHAWIQHTHEAMRRQAQELPVKVGEEDDIAFASRVIPAESVTDGIITAGGEADLVFIGASEESLIDQMLFGSIPEDVARRCPTPVLMVKRFQGLRRFWLRRLWDALYGALPKLDREEMVEIYKGVRRNARPDIDFFVMMGLSAIIATYGLLQDSTAVIIGAMLVAPLFTPILALSLAIAQGDGRLLRVGIEASIKGIALAIGVAVMIAILSPLRSLGHEVLARTQPNLFDLAVALASGAAGAYAIARKDVATSLPGVAIAAALVPPLCVVGVGLAVADPRVSGGGALLFLTNLVAIVFAGVITLLLLGFRPTERGIRTARLRAGLITSLVSLLLISVPLAIFFIRSVQETRIHTVIGDVLSQEVAEDPGLELLEVQYEQGDGAMDIVAKLYIEHELSEEMIQGWRDALREQLDSPVELHVITIPVQRILAPAP